MAAQKKPGRSRVNKTAGAVPGHRRYRPGQQACSAKGSRRRARETRRSGPGVGRQDRGIAPAARGGRVRAPAQDRRGRERTLPATQVAIKNARQEMAAWRSPILTVFARELNENSRVDTTKSINRKIYSAFVAHPFPSGNGAETFSSVRQLPPRPRHDPERAMPVMRADTASRRSRPSSRIPAAWQKAIAPAIRDSLA